MSHLRERLAYALYGLLLRLIAPLYVLRLWLRGKREPLYRHAIGERFGHYVGQYVGHHVGQHARSGSAPTLTFPGAAAPTVATAAPATARDATATRPADGLAPVVWLHAVSLGETRAAAALVDVLRAQQPGLRLVLTHGTATGREAGQALLREGDTQVWLPLDTPGAVRRFFARWQPMVGVLMETEVWPNLMRGARAAGVPVVLANARLSERSLQRGLPLSLLLRPAMTALHRALAQTPADAARLQIAGVRRIDVMGNLKFDVAPDPALLALGNAWAHASARPLVLAASTREGEEAPLLQAWLAGQSTLPNATGSLLPPARLLIVPRHPQRFDEVAGLIADAGLSVSRRSRWPDGMPDGSALQADVWLGDSLGELPAYYAAARVALLGGSFEPLGGQNLIEAAACACPVIMGPHTFNFGAASEMAIEAGAARRVADVAQGVRRSLGLVIDVRVRAGMARSALDFAAAHRGAAQRMALAIAEVIHEVIGAVRGDVIGGATAAAAADATNPAAGGPGAAPIHPMHVPPAADGRAGLATPRAPAAVPGDPPQA